MSKVKFGDVVTRANTKEDKDNTEKIYYVGGEHIDSNEVVIEKRGLIAGSTIGPMFYFGFNSGQVLFVTRNPHLRKAGMVTFDGICSEKTFVLETKDENILLQRYLPFIMQSDHFWSYMEAHKSGSVNFFINWSTLAKYEFELPDIGKQESLSEMLWAINNTKLAYRNLIAKTDDLVKAQFIEMFGDTVSDNQKYDSVPLIDIFDKPQGGEWGADDPSGTGTPVLRTTNFTDDGYVDYTDVATRIINPQKLQKKSLLKGDILIEKSGGSNDKPVGRVVFFEGEDGVYLNNNFTARLHLNSKYELINEYVFFFMFVNYWSDGTKVFEGKTTGIHNLHLTDYLQSTRIPIAPGPEQEKFVLLFRQSDKSKFELQQAITNLEGLQKSLLSENFQ